MVKAFSHPIAATAALLRRLRDNRRGNVLVLAAAAMVPMTVSAGFGIDYAHAMRLQSQMNAAADAAALAAVTAPMMVTNDSSAQATAKAAAVAMFKGQIANLSGLTFNATTDLTVTVSTSGSLNNGRKAVVVWKAQAQNIFGPILGSNTLPITGSASSQAVKAPYINFYLMMDSSPSMLLPTTSAGMSSILTATTNSSKPYGCAFACHAQLPRNDAIYVRDSKAYDIFLNANYYASSGTAGFQTFYRFNPTTKTLYDSNGTQMGDTGSAAISTSAVPHTLSYKTTTKVACTGSSGGCSGGYKNSTATTSITGYYADGYWLTHNYSKAFPGYSNVETRIDAERLAAQQLIPYAASQASANGVTYNMQMFSFDWTHSGTSPIKTLTSSMADVATLSASSVPDMYASQDYWYANNMPTSSRNISDQATEVHTMLSTMYANMPVGGDGSSASNPKSVMFLITDGVADEAISGSRWNREFNATHLADCTNLKTKKNVTIAILYTQYLPESLTGDSWSQSALAPYLPNVAPALKSCASTGSDGQPLFYQVTTDQNISDALVALFALVVQQAHLVQ